MSGKVAADFEVHRAGEPWAPWEGTSGGWVHTKARPARTSLQRARASGRAPEGLPGGPVPALKAAGAGCAVTDEEEELQSGLSPGHVLPRVRSA